MVVALARGTQRWLDAHHEVLPLPKHFEFRVAFGQLDQLLRRFSENDAGVADQSDEGCREIKVVTVAVAA
jgi:hypothetical protein